MNNETQAKEIQKIIGKCWADDAFKQKLLSDPAAALKEHGAEIPAGYTVKAVANTDSVIHLVIPAKPKDLSDADLDKVAGGTFFGSTPFSVESPITRLGRSEAGRVRLAMPILL